MTLSAPPARASGAPGTEAPQLVMERDGRKVLGWRRHRLDLQPGITGYRQVLGRNSISFEEMLEFDYAHVAGWSMWHDLKLLLQTVPAVLRRRGANLHADLIVEHRGEAHDERDQI
jgi:hypothetical protein